MRRLTAPAVAVAVAPAAFGADVTVRQLSESLFKATVSSPVDFAGKDLRELDLAGLDFKSAKLAGANLYGTDLSDANLAGADLSGVKLDRATITRTNFSNARLEQATLLRPSVYSELAPHPREAPRFTNARMASVRIFGRLDFADFRGAQMQAAEFVGTDGRDENLSLGRGSYRAADFSGAGLSQARMGGSNFSYARFSSADLRDADLRGADLTRADFTGADLSGADVTGADLDEAIVKGAKGLETLKGLASARNADRLVR